MATLHIDPALPEITPSKRLAGWHCEFCIELLGDGEARIFVRAVEQGSLKAFELQRAILFQRLDTRFTNLTGCMESLQADLDQLVGKARRIVPNRDNLFTTVEYDRSAWERVQTGLERWARGLKTGPSIRSAGPQS